MVEQEKISLETIKQNLIGEIDKLWETRMQFDLHSENDDKNISVRYKYDELPNGECKMVLMSECKLVPGGLLPNDFAFYPEAWPDLIKEINPRIAEVKDLGEVDGFPVVSIEATAPWPLSNRLICQWRCGIIDKEASNHYFLLSSQGVENLLTIAPEDESKYALAYLHVGGFKFMPLKDESGKVIGTTLFNVQSSNPGGNIPSAMSNKVGPAEALKAMEQFVKVMTKQHKLKAMASFFTQCEQEAVFMDAAFKDAVKEYQAKEAAMLANSIITEDQQADNYAIIQQGLIGDCNTEQPGFFSRSARFLWGKWDAIKGMPKADAQMKFLKMHHTS